MSEQSTTHTPTPWLVEDTTIFFRNAEHDNEPAIAECGPHSEATAWIERESPDPETTRLANARFIVRAVNSHDALVDICDVLLKRFDLEVAEGREIFPGAALREDLRNALAAAR